jgi:hypothetical protein
MCNRDHETQHIIALQGDMFRLARRDYALSYKRLSLLSGIPDSTIESWAKGVAMPLHGFIALAPHIPDDLLSMVVEPAGSSSARSSRAATICTTSRRTAPIIRRRWHGQRIPTAPAASLWCRASAAGCGTYRDGWLPRRGRWRPN